MISLYRKIFECRGIFCTLTLNVRKSEYIGKWFFDVLIESPCFRFGTFVVCEDSYYEAKMAAFRLLREIVPDFRAVLREIGNRYVKYDIYK